MAARPPYPLRIEQRHQVRLRRYVDRFAPAVQRLVVDRLGEIYPEPEPDVAVDGLVVLNDALGELRLEWERVASQEQIWSACEATGREVERASAAAAQRSLRSVGVRVVPGSYLEDLLPGWVEAHTALIVRGDTWQGRPVIPMGEETIGQIGEVVREGFAVGKRHEAVADEIVERLGVMRSRANLIARDQTNKLNGRMLEERFTRAGVMRYKWRTSRDERVRQTHAELEGTEWDFRSPPVVGNPGEDIQCRCTPEPVRPRR